MRTQVVADIDFTEPLPGWRLWGRASHLLNMQYQGETQIVRYAIVGHGHYQLLDVDTGELILDMRIDSVSMDRLVVEVNGLRKSVSVVRWNIPAFFCVCVSAEGRSMEFRHPDPLESADEAASNADDINAPMTGVIRLLDVVAGQSVKAGERLLVLEAMKMETSVTAPRDGVVSQLHCRAEDTVDGGSLLVSLEKVEPAA